MKRIAGILIVGLILLFSNMALAERDGNQLLSDCSVAVNIIDGTYQYQSGHNVDYF